MAISLKTAVICAGVCGVVGYCKYFDYKRRSDPEFKSKLLAKRSHASSSKKPPVKFPNETDSEDLNAFLTVQLQKAQICIVNGNSEDAYNHSANAFVVFDSEERSEVAELLEGLCGTEFVYEVSKKIPEAEIRLQDYRKNYQAQEMAKFEELPPPYNIRECEKYISKVINLTLECLSEGDVLDAANYITNIIVIIPEEERTEFMKQIQMLLSDRCSFLPSAKIFGIVLKKLPAAQKRFEKKLLEEDHSLTFKFCLVIALALYFK